MKLELKHIAPYLSYGLKKHCPSSNVLIHEYSPMDFIQSTIDLNLSFGWKPVLRPMSDLSKMIEHPIDKSKKVILSSFYDLEVDEDGDYCDRYYADQCESPSVLVSVASFNWWLFEYHFDVFGLIDQGLAIDINHL